MTAPHCTNVNHNEVTCMAAGLQPEEYCEPCLEFYQEQEAAESLDYSAIYEYLEDYE